MTANIKKREKIGMDMERLREKDFQISKGQAET
jgi:hypothetical protein